MDNTYVSKDEGLTWTKRVGNSLTRSVYDGKFVDVGTSLSLITKRNQRTDGSSISPDVITIGQEGATTVIGGQTVIDNLAARNIEGVSTTGTQSLFGTKTEGNLSVLGAGTGTMTVNGSGIKCENIKPITGVNDIILGAGSAVTIDDTLKVATINGYGVDTIIRIGTSLTTGSIQMGNSQTTGSISLGSSASTTTINGTLITTTINPVNGNLNIANNGYNIVMGSGGGAVSVAGSGGLFGKILYLSSDNSDSDRALQFTRNGRFTMGIAATANPKLIMGVATGVSAGNEVQILSLGTGTVYSNSGTLSNTGPSDKTLKKNITSLDASIDDLNPIQYEWIDTKMGVGIKYGFLANEVIKIFPDICSTWKTDEEDGKERQVKLGLDIVSLIPIIVSSMKKMKQDYDAKLSTLEARLLALETKV